MPWVVEIRLRVSGLKEEAEKPGAQRTAQGRQLGRLMTESHLRLILHLFQGDDLIGCSFPLGGENQGGKAAWFN